MEMLDQKQKFLVVLLIIIAAGIIIFYYFNSTKNIYNNEETNIKIESEEETTEEVKESENIIVHITGAVKNNGIIEIKKDARLNDVIEAAGGITKDADLTNVNLAYKVEDGQKINIPKEEVNKIEEDQNTIKEVISNGPGNEIIENYREKEDDLVNINKASLEELKTLPGIGTSTAQKIIEYRNENGKFKKIEDIKNISGIGDAKFDIIKNYICI